MIRVSIGTTKAYQAIVINVNGKDLKIDVDKYKFDISSHNLYVLDKIITSVTMLKGVLDANHIQPTADEFVIIEFRNQHVFKWLTQLKVPKQHSKKQLELLWALDEIPYHIKYVHTDAPKAIYYATEEQYIKNKPKYSNSMDEFLALTDD